MTERRLGWALLPAAGLLVTVGLRAAPGLEEAKIQGEPIQVKADRLEVDLAGKSAALDGKVELRRGEVTLSCDHLDARFTDGAAVTWARGRGSVALQYRGARVTAPEFTLDLGRRRIELTGGATVQRGASRLTAQGAAVDLATERLSLTGVEGLLAAPPAASSAAPPSSR